MDYASAFTYLREDKQLALKLVGLATMLVFGVLPLLLMWFLLPRIGAGALLFLVGLPATMIAFGYMMNIAFNVRNGLPRPLPEWSQWRVKLLDGAHLLLAMLIYHLPLILFNLVFYGIVNTLTGNVMGQNFVNAVSLCCSTPITLMYLFFVWSLLGAGLTEYLETRDPNRFYRISHLIDVVQTHNRLIRRWLVYATLTTLGFALFVWIPCIGQFALLFVFPVQGHLFGQFARQLNAATYTR